MGGADATTFLFVPGDRPDRFEKARSSGADCVVLDLEDAVAPAAKNDARRSVATYLANGGRALVRINSKGSPWFRDDLAAISGPGLDAIIVPKAESAVDLVAIAECQPGLALLPMIESARGIANLPQLASASNVTRIVFGSIDLQLDLGISGDSIELLYFRSMLVLESRLAGLSGPVDGICSTIDDPEALSMESGRARRLGFSGKLCIHPRQIGPVAAAFRPSLGEVDHACKIVEASDAVGGGAVLLGGRMIDRPIVEMARITLEKHGCVATPGSRVRVIVGAQENG